jgi:hypothetical protein
MDAIFDFLERDITLLGIAVHYWTIIAVALLVVCIAAWLFSKKI